MKNKFFFYLFIVFFVSACGAQPPDIDEEVLTDNYDWCYTFDFLTETYDLSFVSGQQTASGLETIDGILGVSYEHSQIVQPAYMSANIEIVIPQGTGARNVVSQINIFGIEEFVQANIPNTVTTSISGSPDSAGISGQTATFSLTTDTDTVVSVRNLSVYGNGSNPFPSNDCDDATPTATSTPFELPTFTPTFTPTATVTATNTPTATPTNTPTNTPTATPENWCYRFTSNWSEFDITEGTPGSNGVEFVQWRYESGNIYRSVVGVVMTIDVPPSSPLTYARVDAQFDYGEYDGNVIDLTLVSASPSNRSNQNIQDNPYTNEVLTAVVPSPSDQDLYIAANGSFTSQNNSYPAYLSAAGRITSVELRGTGSNPYGTDNCNVTPTSTPTNTAPATATSNPTNTPIATSTSDGGGGSTPNPSASPETLTPSPTSTFSTSTPIATLTPITTGTPNATYAPDASPTFQPTVTPDPGDDTNSFTSGGTCTNYTGAEPGVESNGNWFEWLFGGFDRLINCVVMPPINFVANLVSQSVALVRSILDALISGINSLWDIINIWMRSLWNVITLWAQRIWDEIRRIGAIIQLIWAFIGLSGEIAVGNATDTLNNIYDLAVVTLASWVLNFEWFRLQFLAWFQGWINNLWVSSSWYLQSLLFGLIDILFDLYFFVTRLIAQIKAFAMNIIGFIYVGFFTAQIVLGLWNNSPAVKPPGLPDCISDPMNYDICAVWYILENTIFSGIGGFIIEALKVGIFLIIAFSFLDTILARIKKLGTLTGD